MVRQAVLKGKDPAQLLDEMEKIDEMEYNVLQPSPLNEKVLKEKRKKLKETFDRVMRLYHTEDPELWSELKRKELEYEKKRNKRISYFESVRQAESIQIDDIPLPSAKEGLTPSLNALPRIQLPPPALIIPPIPQALVMQVTKPPEEPMEEEFDDEQLINGPSCPPGPPPNLDAMEDLDSDYDESLLPKNQKKMAKAKEKSEVTVSAAADDGDDALKPPSALQQKMLAISGQNIDDFMKEMENVQRKKEAERAEKAGNPLSESEEKDSEDDSHHSESEDDQESDESAKEEEIVKPAETVVPEPIPLPPQAPAQIQMQVPIPMPNHHIMPHIPGMFRPPPMRGGFSGHHHHPGMRIPPRMGIRMPPAPPPGMPPKYAKGPQPNKDPKSATIEAKPQIRNLSADVTRFVPSTLRSKKDDPKKPKQKMVPTSVQMPQQTQPTKAPTKDDAYMQFMKEMQGFL